MTFLARRIDCAWIVDFHSKMVSNGLNTAASQIRRVCKIAPRGQCATARRDFAHAAGREPRGCTPYTAAQPKGRASQSSSPLIGVDRPREWSPITRSVGQNLTRSSHSRGVALQTSEFQLLVSIKLFCSPRLDAEL